MPFVKYFLSKTTFYTFIGKLIKNKADYLLEFLFFASAYVSRHFHKIE